MIPSLANNFVLGVLFILASGYVVYDAPICRWFWSKYAGYILYFRIITAGLILLLLLYPLVGLFDLEPEYALFLTLPAALLFRLLAKAAVWADCKCRPERGHELKLKKLDERGFEQFVYERVRDKRMILITLDNKKVYAGWPLEIPNNEDKKWLRFVPQWSGYRDKESMINIQIDYSKVFDASPVDRDYMLIPVDKIVTMHPFEVKTFLEFNPEFRPTAPSGDSPQPT